jgi:hypothetical protein
MMPFPSLWQPLYLLGGLSMALFHCLQNFALWGRFFALFVLLGVLLAHFSARFARFLGSFFGHFC